jgi:hypothetical protein
VRLVVAFTTKSIFALCTLALTMVPPGVPSLGTPVQAEGTTAGKPSTAGALTPASTISVNGFQMSSMPISTRTPAFVAAVA